jgi:hypothetical protein
LGIRSPEKLPEKASIKQGPAISTPEKPSKGPTLTISSPEKLPIVAKPPRDANKVVPKVAAQQPKDASPKSERQTPRRISSMFSLQSIDLEEEKNPEIEVPGTEEELEKKLKKRVRAPAND